MSFLAPLVLGLGALAAAAVVALHLLTTRRPPPSPLPTARFVPLSEARAVARARRPTDLFLLAMRVLALLLIGAAFARPVLDAPGPRVRSVVLLDLSATVADPRGAAERAREALGEGSALVVFDTAARDVPLDSLAPLAEVAASDEARPAVGALSPALAAARRVAGEVARGADSLRLVIVSPLGDRSFDVATVAWRRAWPGRVEVVRVPAATDKGSAIAPALIGAAPDDPLSPTLSLLRDLTPTHAVRIVRRAPDAADTAWLRAGGALLVSWPRSAGEPRPDAVHVAGAWGVTLVAPLARSAVDGARVIARWRDGAPAVTETPIGAGCARQVGVGVPSVGDLPLREPFARFVTAMMAPCGGPRGAPVADSIAAGFAGSGPLAPARLLAAESQGDARIPLILLALAIAGLATEWAVRRKGRA